MAWGIAFSRTARLQQARLTLDPFRLDPADLDGLDHLNGSWLHKSARSEIAELVGALSATQSDPDNPGRDRALACYDAAALLAGERNDRLDLLGAVVLAREGHYRTPGFWASVGFGALDPELPARVLEYMHVE
jgi:hypothetical protein